MTNSPSTRYQLQKKLGAGAMGTVWLATDTLLNRPVALKYLKITQQTIYKELFVSEAQLLASLNHPNITQIYDAVFDEPENRFYLVMEYVPGISLSEFIAKESCPLPFDFVLNVGLGAARALQYAHQKGVVHRDIKPENVIIQADGLKLTDFGVAGLISRLAEGSNYIVGTPAYISPEQIEGIPLDGRADLYSLGVMLYELASGGALPFAGSTALEWYQAHLELEPYPLREVAPEIPLAFEQVVMRLLAKQASDRYPSAGTLLDILTSLQARQKFSQPQLQLLDSPARPLVNRADELEQLETIWTATRQAARPRLVVVQGEAGLGKSRLITEFLARQVIDRGWVGLVGRGGETGAPYAPFAEILAAIFNKGLAKASVSSVQLERLLDHIPSLARLLNLPETPAGQSQPEPANQPMVGLWQSLGHKVTESAAANLIQRHRQFMATVLTILTELGPTVLFLENATALDEASLTLLRFLLEQGQLPLLLVAACRPKAEPPAWPDSFSTAKTVLTLPRLSNEAVHSYLTQLLGGVWPAEMVDLLNERGRGNPLQIEAGARRMQELGQLRQDETGVWHYVAPRRVQEPTDSFLPKAVFDSFSRRVEQLSDASREVLAVAAILEPGYEFDFDSWLALLGGESQRELAQTVLAEALKARLVRQFDDRRYAFRPADVGKALLRLLPENRQRDLHRQAAEILQQQQSDPLLVAYHYQQISHAAAAACYLETAGARAMTANALNAATVYYERAVALVESPAGYKALGNLYRESGELAKSAQAFEQAMALTGSAADVELKAQIMNGWSFTLWLSDRYRPAYQQAAAVLKLPGLVGTERALACSNLGMISWLAGRLSDAADWCLKGVKAATGPGHKPALSTAHYRLGLVYTSQTRLAEAETVFREALALRQELGWLCGQADCLQELGRIAGERGDFDAAWSQLDAAQQLFEQIGSQGGLLSVYTGRGRLRLYQSHPDEALPWLSQALKLAVKQSGNAYRQSDIYRLLAQAGLQQRKLERARAAANNALNLVEAAGNQEYIALAQATLAEIYAAQGNAAAAEAMYLRALALFEQVGHRAGWLRAQVSYARFLAKQGETERAAALERVARQEAEQVGVALFLMTSP